MPLASLANSVISVIEDRADWSEEHRRVDEDVIECLVAAGFARHFVPTAKGGDGGTFTDLLAAVSQLGHSSAAASWTAALMASIPRMVAYLDTPGRDLIWSEGADQIIVGAVSPGGVARREPDGWVLSGRWPIVSAIEFADWALVMARDGHDGGELHFFLIPESECQVTHTWNAMGMRGTGSNALAVSEVKVPDALTMPCKRVLIGSSILEDPCHKVPLAAVNGLSFVGPMLGAVQAAVLGRLNAALSTTTRIQAVAHAAAVSDAVELVLTRAAHAADCGHPMSPRAVARSVRDFSWCATQLREALQALVWTAPMADQADGSLLERAWRDTQVASGHIALDAVRAANEFVTIYSQATSEQGKNE